MRLTIGSDIVMDFAYDHNGQPYAVNYNGTKYYYVLNLQGDVVKIVSSIGTSYGTYTYDAWGNILYASSGNLMTYNPLRYRGYVYDTETGLYYVSSRYYDPEVGRFINADSFASTGQGVIGNNMFAYCGNNPVIHKDSFGSAFDTVFDIISLGFSIAEVAANPADFWAWASLSGDLADVLLPFVSGLGEMIDGMRAAGYADEVAEAISTLATTGSAVKKGRRGEILVGIFTDSGKGQINIDGRTRIPDLLTDDTLMEVKNVAYLSNTQQLKDFAQYADSKKIPKILYVRPDTKCSQSLIDAGWDIRSLW